MDIKDALAWAEKDALLNLQCAVGDKKSPDTIAKIAEDYVNILRLKTTPTSYDIHKILVRYLAETSGVKKDSQLSNDTYSVYTNKQDKAVVSCDANQTVAICERSHELNDIEAVYIVYNNRGGEYLFTLPTKDYKSLVDSIINNALAGDY